VELKVIYQLSIFNYLTLNYNSKIVLIILESKDNKGTYYWTRTVSDVITVKQCQANEEVEPLARGTVSRHCNLNGIWEVPDTLDCPYTSPTTRIFYTQSKVWLSLNINNIKNY